ncbi:hypothetical protein SAMN02746095_02206 [Acidocella aminolytica 101 = DSM 11237]|jgi:hypothetical protein|nr:hypothetical protein SAMN02746095_02206 [Acidocella aminolytica 101 = DSM 11237]
MDHHARAQLNLPFGTEQHALPFSNHKKLLKRMLMPGGHRTHLNHDALEITAFAGIQPPVGLGNTIRGNLVPVVQAASFIADLLELGTKKPGPSPGFL